MAVRNNLSVAWGRPNLAHICTQRTQALFQAIRHLLDDEDVDDELLENLAALGIAECDTILSSLQKAQHFLEQSPPSSLRQRRE